MRIAFVTLGCKVNQYETSCLASLFEADGFTLVDSEEIADVYVVNSCTVTETGDKKTRQMLTRLHRQNTGALIALCGCMPQAFPQVADTLPLVQVITGAVDRGALLGQIKHALNTGERVVSIPEHKKGQPFESMQTKKVGGKTRAFIKIQEGCDRHCAYCIIPKARGTPRSKPLEEIRTEITDLSESGHKEVVLSGISLASYGKESGAHLLQAVEVACAVPNIARVRLGSLDPDLITDTDIARLQALYKLCPQFHLSLQSGCDATLKRMRRRYTTATYQKLVAKLRAAFPLCAITSDVMVGFPGESPEEFAQTLAFVASIGFANLHVFAYSPRAGTQAATFPNQISPAEKQRRSHLLKQYASTARHHYHQQFIGKTIMVLFEHSTDKNYASGHSKEFIPVTVEIKGSDATTSRQIATTILPVTIIKATSKTCIGCFL